MTQRKTRTIENTPLELNLYRLRKIAALLESGNELSTADTKFLSEALWKIGEGTEANEALGVKAKRGESPSLRISLKNDRIRSAMAYIATLIAPISEYGGGLTLGQAIEATAEKCPGEPNFDYTEETLRYYWSHYPDLQTREFSRPIATLPHRTVKNVKK